MSVCILILLFLLSRSATVPGPTVHGFPMKNIALDPMLLVPDTASSADASVIAVPTAHSGLSPYESKSESSPSTYSLSTASSKAQKTP